MNLEDIQLTPGTSFKLECRIRYPNKRIASNGSNYLTFIIEDSSGSLRAYAWQNQCIIPPQMGDLDRVSVRGSIREFDGRIFANIRQIEHGGVDTLRAIDLIPRSLCPEPQLLQKLKSIVSSVENKPLRHFLDSVFADDAIALPFVRLPASKNNHHAAAGGLLRHSLECVEMVQRFSEFGQDMLDLAVAGALLHDTGKIVTLRNEKFCLEGVLLDHDALTLEVLAPHLARLDGINRDIAVALRYLWTWRHYRRGMKHPALTIAEALAAVDRISSGLNAEQAIFSNRPAWQTVARSETYGQKYWRPQLGYTLGGIDLKHAQA
jgi:3'-5' exoribonuclease